MPAREDQKSEQEETIEVGNMFRVWGFKET